jgi:hypothetical protein
MAKRRPGPGDPAENQRLAEQQVREHARLHRGEPGKVAGPMKVTHPVVPGAPEPRRDGAADSRPSEYDPACEARPG